MGTIILISTIVTAIFLTALGLFSRFKRCPSDKLLVIYGKGTGGATDKSAAKVVHGGAAFIIPVFQDFQYLDLKPISIEIALKNALSKQNIRINVPSTFTVAVSAEPGTRENAAERLLGLGKQEIAMLAQDIIFGQMRLVIATMDIEEINNNRDKFLTNIQTNLEGELVKIGLKLINVNVQDITDESGYIEALGKEAAALAINEAKKVVAEKDRDGSIGSAEAKQEERIKVAALLAKAEIGEAEADRTLRIQKAEANSLAEVGEAEADRNLRVQKAIANATAIEGENKSAILIANSASERKVKQSEADRVAITAEKVNAAVALKDSYLAKKEAEDARAAADSASEYANVIVPAEINKKRMEIDAEAEAEKTRRIAKGKADGIYFEMEAQAKGIKEILSKQAEGLKVYIDAAGGDPQKAMMLMVTDKLPELYKIQAEAIQNIKFDKITVWDSGNGSGSGSATSDWMQNALKSIPAFKDIYESVGAKLPTLLQGANEEVKIEAKKEVNK